MQPNLETEVATGFNGNCPRCQVALERENVLTQRVAQLSQEVAQLRQENDALRSASAAAAPPSFIQPGQLSESVAAPAEALRGPRLPSILRFFFSLSHLILHLELPAIEARLQQAEARAFAADQKADCALHQLQASQLISCYLDAAISLGAYSYDGREAVFALPSAGDCLPANATHVCVSFFLRCAREGPLDRSFETVEWTQSAGNPARKLTVHRHWAHRYPPQPAISFDSPSCWMELDPHHRAIHVFSQDVQADNCHGMRLWLWGYRVPQQQQQMEQQQQPQQAMQQQQPQLQACYATSSSASNTNSKR